jgi:segregation and condensation protein B
MSKVEPSAPQTQGAGQAGSSPPDTASGAPFAGPIALAFEELKLKVEAILFASDRPLEVAEIRELIGNVSLTDVRLALKDLGHDFEGRSVHIVEVGRRFQLRTRATYTETVSRLFAGKPRSLSRAALETLAIVAYRQPVTRAEVAALRRVDSSHLISALKEKELICASGTRREVGNPVEYRTTPKFLDVFGLASLDELPRLRSLQMNPDDAAEVRKALEEFDAQPASEEPQEELDAADLNFMDEEDSPKEAAIPHEPEAPPHDGVIAEPSEAPDAPKDDGSTLIREGAFSAPMLLFSADEDADDADQPEEDQVEEPKRSRLTSVESLLRPVPKRRPETPSAAEPDSAE